MYLIVNGKKCMVRSNQWALLFRLRIFLTPRTLWIDALCINQRDIEERNAQVSIMSDIYRQADILSVWLGEAADNSDLVMEVLHPVYHKYLGIST